MKKRIFGLISILVGIVLSLAVLEVVAIAWMQIEDGHYTPASELFDRTQNTYVRDMTKGTDCRYVDTLFPHPYLAFVHHGNPPCGKPNVNNIGLLGEDFPTVKRTDRYTVLLTGGSVASQLGQIAPPPAPRYLEEELNAHYVSPTGQAVPGAERRRRCMEAAAGLHPVRALLELGRRRGHARWLQRALYVLEGHQGAAGAAAQQLPRRQSLRRRREFWRRRDRLGGRPGRRRPGVNPILGHSHAAYMIVRGIEAFAKSKDVFSSTKRTTLASLFALPPEIVANYDEAFAVQLGLYQKYVRSIEAIARDEDVKTAYFLQPAPAIGKTLTEEEVRNAGDLGYRDLYRKIVAGMMTLRDRGLAIFDLADVFKDEKGSIYEDHVHFRRDASGESRGYRLVAKAMAEKMAETWGLQPKK